MSSIILKMDQIKQKLVLLKSYPQEVLLAVCLAAVLYLGNEVNLLHRQIETYATTDRERLIQALTLNTATLNRFLEINQISK